MLSTLLARASYFPLGSNIKDRVFTLLKVRFSV